MSGALVMMPQGQPTMVKSLYCSLHQLFILMFSLVIFFVAEGPIATASTFSSSYSATRTARPTAASCSYSWGNASTSAASHATSAGIFWRFH